MGVSSNRSGGGRGVSSNRSVSSNRGSNKGGGVSTSGGGGLSSNGVRGQGLAVALSVAVSEVSTDPLRVGAAVAILGAALGSGGAASWPLESLHRGPEGGGGAASLAVTGSKEASLAASCGAQQQNSHSAHDDNCLRFNNQLLHRGPE